MSRRRSTPGPCLFFAWLLLGGSPLAGQLISDTLDLGHTQPEAWLMSLVGSELLMTAPIAHEVEPWSVRIGLEAGWLPSLSAQQRRVGFNGMNDENVNRSPAFGRARVSIGLPGRFSLGVGYIPPIRVGGIRPDHLSWSLGRPIASHQGWRVGGRLHGQVGDLEGDITCDRKKVAAGADSVRNPYDCEQVSHDELRLRAVGLEVGAAFPMATRFEPNIAFGWNYFGNEFQVDARYSGKRDRTLLRSSGSTFFLRGGADYRFLPRSLISVTGLYTPLYVRRGGRRIRDGLFNLRVAVFHRFR